MGILNVTPDSFSDAGVHFDRRGGDRGGVADGRGGGRPHRRGRRVHPAGIGSRRPCEEELRPGGPGGDGPLRRAAGPPLRRHLQGSRGRAGAGGGRLHDQRHLRVPLGSRDGGRGPGRRLPGDPHAHAGRAEDHAGEPVYEDVVAEVYEFFVERLSWAVDQGIDRGATCSSIRASASARRSRTTWRCSATWTASAALGRPVVLGTSRKRFIGEVLGLPEPTDRVRRHGGHHGHGPRSRGWSIVRVHDVEENAQAVRLARAVWAAGA